MRAIQGFYALAVIAVLLLEGHATSSRSKKTDVVLELIPTTNNMMAIEVNKDHQVNGESSSKRDASSVAGPHVPIDPQVARAAGRMRREVSDRSDNGAQDDHRPSGRHQKRMRDNADYGDRDRNDHRPAERRRHKEMHDDTADPPRDEKPKKSRRKYKKSRRGRARNWARRLDGFRRRFGRFRKSYRRNYD